MGRASFQQVAGLSYVSVWRVCDRAGVNADIATYARADMIVFVVIPVICFLS